MENSHLNTALLGSLLLVFIISTKIIVDIVDIQKEQLEVLHSIDNRPK